MRSTNVTNPNEREQFKTKLTQHQKERMFEFAERVGWELQKRDKELISDFCSKFRVKKWVLKVWMQYMKKNSTTMGRANVTNPNGRKELRTKFTQHQRERRMFEFAQRVGWELQKRDEKLINKFCNKIGVKKGVLKAWMQIEKKSSTTSTADILPECLVQKILCYLSLQEAAKKSILSTTWLQAWLTLPNLKVKVDYYTKGIMKIVDNIMKRYRDGKIPIEKFELSNSRYSGEDFSLINKWLDIALQNGVKDLVFRGLRHTLPILKIVATKSLRELVLSDCNLKGVSLSSGVAKLQFIEKALSSECQFR